MSRSSTDFVSKAVHALQRRRTEGDDLFVILVKEHATLRASLAELSRAPEPEQREELFPALRRELLSHERAELLTIYPALWTRPETREIAEAQQRDAGRLEQLLDELTWIPFQDPSWGENLGRLVTLTQHHAAFAENELFPICEHALADEREELQAHYEAAKHAVRKRFLAR